MTFEEAIRAAIEHHRAGRLGEAEQFFRQLIDVAPNVADLHQHLAFVLEDLGRDSEAAGAYQSAIQRAPGDANLHGNLAAALIRLKRWDEAEQICRATIVLDPASAQAHDRLGGLFTEGGRPEEALAHHQWAIELQPGFADAHYNFGVALHELRRFDEAIAEYERAIEIAPELAEAHAKLGIALLTRGDLSRGWPEYEWRRKWTRPTSNPALEWDGLPLNGREIVLEAEQGFGDAIQLIRYAPLVAQRGGRVTVTCPASLTRLFERVDGVERVVLLDQADSSAMRVSLMSLPGLFSTTLATVPNQVPYLRVSEEEIQHWRLRIGEVSELKVGIAWRGNRMQREDQYRSCEPQDLRPLAACRSVRFFSLQKNAVADQAHELPFPMIDWTGDLNDFADTAALVANLDLIITVDSAVAHLAGAMGKPTWVLLFFNSDWRWLLNRDDSPWYPTARLFRQQNRGDWAGPVACVTDELTRFSDAAG